MSYEFEEVAKQNVFTAKLSASVLEDNVRDGLFKKIENHKEHIALHPFWISDPKNGILEELNKGLGKWNAS